MPDSPIISLRAISKHFGGALALDSVSLDILPGELHAICGENGAGKSTLMKILSGVIVDYRGEYCLRGQPVAFRGTRDAEQAGVSIIHQELNLVEQLSAAANIFLGREIRTRWGGLHHRKMEELAQGWLRELECHVSPRQLAGELRLGDQQLVEIAKALSRQADILVMDEPTSALSETEVARLDRVIARLRERGVTILYISHKMDEVFRLADRITVLRDGRLIETMVRSQTNPGEVTRKMVGRELSQTRMAHPPAVAEPILQVRNLSLPWPGHVKAWRLQNISFDLRPGEILGIAGLMGAGRTELLEALFGASSVPPQGEIRLQGRPVRFRHPFEAQQAGLALVTEDRKRSGLFPHLTVRDNISMSVLTELATAGVVRPARERRLVAETITDLAIKTSGPEASVLSLSGGNQQKCIIGRWLRTRPQVLLLDDPTRGIDVGAKAELYQLFDRLCQQGLAMIVTSSELPELLTLSDRILVLCEGVLTAEFSRAEANEHAILAAATKTLQNRPA